MTGTGDATGTLSGRLRSRLLTIVETAMTPDASSSVSLLDALRRRDPIAPELLADRYRSWLQLLARLQVDSQFQGKFDASDLVQQTLLEACRDLPQFRGQT